jgi:hypothetical protein
VEHTGLCLSTRWAHDLSDIFTPSKAALSSEALSDQPEHGGMTGFDFYRDRLGAMKPGMTFEEVYKAAVANKPNVLARQRKLLENRFNLEPRFDPNATMSRGKPLVVGPTARLPTFETSGLTLLKRLTLVIDGGLIEHVFYPVFPPDQNAGEVLTWLAAR